MDQTIVNFYRGTMGMGIVISVSYGMDRILLDFGAPFTPMSEIYDGIVLKRNRNKVKDALLLGRIPEVPGVFSKDDLQGFPLQAYEESDCNTAVFICHLHLDHMSEIDKLAKKIPVYIHEDGIRLYDALHVTDPDSEYRICQPFHYHQEIRIGQISLTPYYSDHPCPGASGFLIRTPDSTIYYSGDIRFHGVNSDRAFAELELLEKENIDLLIVDATTTSPSEAVYDPEKYRQPGKDLYPGCISEQDIYEQIFDILDKKGGLAVFNCYNRDTEMMKHLCKLSERLERTIVFEPESAYILKQMSGIEVPMIELKNQNSPAYQREMKQERIAAETIRKNPGNYLLQNSYANILTLTDFDGIKGEYFHLFGEPLVEGTKTWKIMTNVVDKLGWHFHSFSNLYSFSHAYPNQLAYLIERINAKSVVAVHSKHPEKLNPVNSRQYFPMEGKDYILKDGSLLEK